MCVIQVERTVHRNFHKPRIKVSFQVCQLRIFVTSAIRSSFCSFFGFNFPPSFALPPCRHTRRYTGLCPLSQTAFLKDASCLQIKIGISVTKGSTEQVTPSTELSSLHFLYSLSFFYCFYSSDEFLCA